MFPGILTLLVFDDTAGRKHDVKQCCVLDCGQTIIVSGPVLAVIVKVNAVVSCEAGEGPIRGRGG